MSTPAINKHVLNFMSIYGTKKERWKYKCCVYVLPYLYLLCPKPKIAVDLEYIYIFSLRTFIL